MGLRLLDGLAHGVVMNPNWRTPVDIVERVRHVFGGVIDLDPASDAEAQKTVRATRYIDADGTWASWGTGSVFINPPGGKPFKAARQALPTAFWSRLMREVALGTVKHAIFLAFSLEQLRTTQTAEGPDMLHFPLCIPRKRIAFVDPDGGKKAAPRYANAIVYVPGTLDRRELFAETFGPLGAVRL